MHDLFVIAKFLFDTNFTTIGPRKPLARASNETGVAKNSKNRDF